MNTTMDLPGSARNFQDRLVLITGGASGVGLECAKHFAMLGAKLLLIGRDTHKLEAACNMLTSQYGVLAVSLAGDVADSAFADAAVAYANEKLDCTVEVLINNAGTIYRKDACETDDQHWHDVFDINVHGVFYFSRAVARQMPRGGVIINVSSTCGSVGSAGLAAYCASKGAVNMLTKTMALELAPKQINVNAVAPGAINSPMLFSKHHDEASANSVVERNIAAIPIGAIAQPQEIARSIIFLCQERHITGEILAIDGGYTAQ